MTPKESFEAAYHFLDEYWLDYRADFDNDLPVLLSSMNTQLFTDGMPADPAFWSDWQECIRHEANISSQTAFAATHCFLENYRALGESDEEDISRLLILINTLPLESQQRWQSAVEQASGSAVILS